MSDVTSRNGWTRVAFGDIVELSRERSIDPERDGLERYIGLEHIDPGSLKVRRWGKISEGTTFRNVFRAGQVLFGKRRAYQRKVAVADFDGVCSGDIYVLKPKNEHLLPDLLPFICQTDGFFEHAVGTSAGSLSPRTNWRSVACYEFALPPLPDQRRISAPLQAADEATERLRALIESERTTEQSLFDELVRRTTTHSHQLGSLLLEPPRNGYSAVAAPSPTGHWVLGLSALTKWGYQRGELKPVQKSEPMVAAVLNCGDLLISRSNTRELVGLAGIFDENRCDVSWPDTMMRLRPDPSRLRPVFLERLLRAPGGRKQIQSFAAGTSASMKKINSVSVQKLLIPVPPVDAQDSINAQLDPFLQPRQKAVLRLVSLVDIKRKLLSNALALLSSL